MAGCCTSDLRPPSLNQPNTNVESPNATPPPHEHSGAQSAKPASARAPCGCRGAQRQGGRAQRASSSSWPELFERSAQRARSEFEGPTLPRDGMDASHPRRPPLSRAAKRVGTSRQTASRAKVEVRVQPLVDGGPTMNATTYAADIAKNVLQVHWVDPLTGEIGRKKLTRAKFTEFFASRQPARIVMEACGSAHHWGRTFEAMGHSVELLP